MLQAEEMLFPRLCPVLGTLVSCSEPAWGGRWDVLQRASGAGGFPAGLYKCKCNGQILQPHVFAATWFRQSLPGEKKKTKNQTKRVVGAGGMVGCEPQQ